MKKYYANGLVKQISNFKNGLKHGKWTYFYKNGKIHYTKNYKNGLLDGRRISFYENGSKAFEGSFKAEAPREFIHGHADRFDESVDMIRAVSDKRLKYLKNFNTEKPYNLPLAYRENMEVMQELLRMRDKGELDENQSLWFRETKQVEELFDTENDPRC